MATDLRLTLERLLAEFVGQLVVVRTRDSGIHVGLLLAVDGRNVLLRESRRLWRWRGANTLHEVATRGVAQEHTRLSEPVSRILLLDGLEIIPAADGAKKSLTTSRWSA